MKSVSISVHQWLKSPVRTILSLSAILAIGVAGYFAWKGTRPTPPAASQTPGLSASPHSSVSASSLSPRVAALLSTESISIAHRKSILVTLGHALSQTDRMALLDCVFLPPPNGVNEREWPSLANDIMQVLRSQQPAMPEYTDRLVGMWLDKSIDPILRDFALQQLREWVADHDTRSQHEEHPEKLALIRQTFQDTCTPGHPYCDPQSTTTGTALLALEEWTAPPAPEAVRIPADDLDRLLLAFAADASAHRGVRATALQLASRRQLPGALPLAREITATPSSDLILRLAAIACLGHMGDTNDRRTLEELSRATNADPLTRGALATALNAQSQPAPR